MTQIELNKIIELHKKWLIGEEDGVRAYLIGADLRGTDLSGANLIEVNLGGANLYRADLSGVDLEKASLEGAKLPEANLEGANLIGANLREANLCKANLRGANLRGANLKNTVVSFYEMSKHDIIVQEDEIYIGCEYHKIDYWLKHYVAIGKEHGYTNEEIEEYGRVLRSLE